jgi:RsmE family RNA methyltransferase
MSADRVNLILFSPEELDRPLPLADPRAVHIRRVLRRQPGDRFDVGLINGPLGQATLVAANAEALTLSFAWGPSPPPPDPITLIVGLPRPQTARDILRDATTLGVAALHFPVAERSEPGYARSSLWTSGEWRRVATAGAEQAFDTRLPEISFGSSLDATIATLPSDGVRLALDNYEAAARLGELRPLVCPVILAVGPERGWTSAERELLRGAGFSLVHLGTRVLRTESACLAALALVRARLGLA